MQKVILFSAVALLSAATAWAGSKADAFAGAGGVQTPVVLKQGTRSVTFYAAQDEVAQLGAGKGSGPFAYRIVSVAPQQLGSKLSDISVKYRKVYYASPLRSARGRYVATGNLLVRFAAGTDVAQFAAARNLRVFKCVNASQRIYLLAPASGGDVVALSNTLTGAAGVVNAAPEWIRPVLLR